MPVACCALEPTEKKNPRHPFLIASCPQALEFFGKMRLQADVLRYMSRAEFRVLTAVEMGMKNHEFVSSALVEQIAGLRRHSIRSILSTLLKNKLVYHCSKSYDGYKLTYLGYDYLALNSLVKRGLVKGVGVRVGVGKESDIHICEGADGTVLILKLHRLGERSCCAARHL